MSDAANIFCGFYTDTSNKKINKKLRPTNVPGNPAELSTFL